MKFIVHTLAALSLIQFSQAEDPLQAAYQIIHRVVHAVEADLELSFPKEELTETERKQVGRYFERPTLSEVYPGIGKAVASRRQP